MSQISPPMRIALVVAVLFGAVYMVALKPKDEAGPAATPAAATPAPATASASDGNAANTNLGKAVESARGAAAASEEAQAARSGESTAPTTSAPSSSTAEAPAASAESPAEDSALANLPNWLQKSMDKKVVAILFTSNKSADDRRTHKALKQAFTAHGKVVKRAVPVSRISKYRPVAEGVDVAQSPTLMVIDRARSAQSLVGYSSVDAINQAIIDGLLATDNPVERVKYLQTVQRECRQVRHQAIIGPTVGDTPAGARRNLTAYIAALGSSLGTLRNAPVPAAYRAVSRDVNHLLARSKAVWTQVRSAAIGAKSVDQVKVRQLTRGLDKQVHNTLLELNAVGVTACN